jgi:hypothetical protein
MLFLDAELHLVNEFYTPDDGWSFAEVNKTAKSGCIFQTAGVWCVRSVRF